MSFTKQNRTNDPQLTTKTIFPLRHLWDFTLICWNTHNIPIAVLGHVEET